MTGGMFEGVFSYKEPPGERQQRKAKVLRSAENLAKSMRREAAERLLDSVELALIGVLRIDVNEGE